MLPQVMPMLAVAAEPFDSPEYCFEIKYDGVRALAAVMKPVGGFGAENARTIRLATRSLKCCAVCRQGRWWTASWWRSTRTVGLICGGCCVGMG